VGDKAVDLHLLRQALESKHCKVWEKAYALCLIGYTEIAKRVKETIKRLDVVESRGRYKGKGS
jgi:tRNA A-37 threonylcarbamoyl transferase component Bud32